MMAVLVLGPILDIGLEILACRFGRRRIVSLTTKRAVPLGRVEIF